jgi:hypothetical protein
MINKKGLPGIKWVPQPLVVKGLKGKAAALTSPGGDPFSQPPDLIKRFISIL